MDRPLISILIPVYQVESYIERCARSVFEQTYNNLEYIFVDDASPDNSVGVLERIIDEYQERKLHTRIIRHPCHKGLAAARNTAVAASQGSFVFHVDSDDWVERDAVELLVNKQQETSADIVTGKAIKHYGGTSAPDLSGGWDLERETLLTQLLTYKVSATLWRRLIKKTLYTDNDIRANETGSGGEDFQVLPRLVYYSHRVAGTERCIYHYNQDNTHSISNNRQQIKVQQQGYESVRVISHFFADKEPCYQDITRELVVSYLYNRLFLNSSWGYREGYEYFRDELLTTNSNNWYFIGWNNPIRRYIDSNYRLFLLARYLYKFFK